MNEVTATAAATHLQQVYLLERDAGLVCRVLGLYAARALDVFHVEYAYAAQMVMKLTVRVGDDLTQGADVEGSVRALVAKASTFVGVIAAAEDLKAVVGQRRDSLYA